jgi:hypothetical protein
LAVVLRSIWTFHVTTGLAALAARAPALRPSLASVEAFLDATRTPVQGGVQFFTPADVLIRTDPGPGAL